MPDERKPHTGQETIYLPTAGPLPGFPGASHGPGLVTLDYEARTVTPVLQGYAPTDEEQAAYEAQEQAVFLQPTPAETEAPAQPEGVSEPAAVEAPVEAPTPIQPEGGA